jgi:endoglucanase
MRALLCFACFLLLTAGAPAATFTMERGLNLDIWTTWPEPEHWDDEEVLANFPEWRKGLAAGNLADIRKAGFDFVRVPIDPAIFLEDASEERIGRLIKGTLASIDLLHKAGLKVVVDFHLIPSDTRKIGTKQVIADTALFERYLVMVERVGKALAATDPATTAFEPLNEPVIDCDPQAAPRWPPMLKRLYASARRAAPAHTLVLSGGCWSSAWGLDKINPSDFGDDNIIWTFHTYEPYFLTHQGADWTGDVMSYVEGLPYPPDLLGEKALAERLAAIRKTIAQKAPEERKSAFLAGLDSMAGGVKNAAQAREKLEEPFQKAEGWGKAHGIPPERIYLGEFGMIRQEYQKQFRMPSAWRAAYLKDMTQAAEKRGYAWSVWSWGGAFGITLDDDKRQLDPVILKGLGLTPR